MHLSLITHYYNNTQKVGELIDHLSSFSEDLRKRFELLLIDDNSEELAQFNSPRLNLKHYRIESPINWNQAGSRNLGVMMSTNPWLLLFDVDQFLIENAFSGLLNSLHNLETSTIYYFKVDNFIDSNLNQPLTVHPNSFLAQSQRFKEWAMYDEDFAGNYGYEDLYLPYVWEKSGGNRKLVGDTVLFNDKGFKTTNLNRSLDINKALAQRKILEGCRRPTHLLRFNWSLVSEHKI
jgi:predicted glycosyltransferase involved in capsule biosynthesis